MLGKVNMRWETVQKAVHRRSGSLILIPRYTLLPVVLAYRQLQYTFLPLIYLSIT